jgi:hypothetical protein
MEKKIIIVYGSIVHYVLIIHNIVAEKRAGHVFSILLLLLHPLGGMELIKI